MKRNIITSIEFKRGKIAIKLVEKFADNNVVIFSSQASIKEVHKFLKVSIDKIEQKIGFKPKQAHVVIEVDEKRNFEQKLVKEKIQILNNRISKKDIDNLLLIAVNKLDLPDKHVILTQPLQFEVVSAHESKMYSQAPINKQADFLTATMCINLIDKEVITYIQNLLLTYSLSITQVFTTYHTISHAKVSASGLKSGAVVLHCGDKHAFIAINKNAGTISSLELSNAGFSNLIKDIAKGMHATEKEAIDIFYVYSNLNLADKNRVIYVKQDGLNKINFTLEDLHLIIKRYLSRIFSVAKKFLDQKNLGKLPIVFSGHIEKIFGINVFAKDIFESTSSTYKPTSFIEVDYSNEHIMGIININKRLEEVRGEDFDTIVHTNPNTFSSLKQKQSKNIFSKLFNNIGGKYEWNN